jgi:hypothetical protein
MSEQLEGPDESNESSDPSQISQEGDEMVLPPPPTDALRKVRSFKVTGFLFENDETSERVPLFDEATVRNPALSSPSFLTDRKMRTLPLEYVALGVEPPNGNMISNDYRFVDLPGGLTKYLATQEFALFTLDMFGKAHYVVHNTNPLEIHTEESESVIPSKDERNSESFFRVFDSDLVIVARFGQASESIVRFYVEVTVYE